MIPKELIRAFDASIDRALADLHTSLIGKVVAVNDNTVNIAPVVARVVNGQGVPLTVLEDVPPIFLNGGSSYDAHPIAVGDYAIVFISERCFDRWYSGDDFVKPAEMRMHDYSDGLALVGLKPQASAITIPKEVTRTGVQRIGTENPSDFAALAGLVLGELEAVKADFDAMKAVFDAHNHSSAGAAPPATPFPAAHTPASVASNYIKTE